MLSFLTLGLIVGMAHALEADHLAAVGTLAARNGGAPRRRMAGLGASWGLGHTTTLFLLSMPMLLLGVVITARVEAWLEFGIGIMLVGMGISVLVKLHRQKVHFHLHEHADGARHFHAHSHKSAKVAHSQDSHAHTHAPLFSTRSYLIGLAHGAAGSAGLMAMAAGATQNLGVTLGYILIFGLGSTIGMAALTLAASWPLKRAEASAGRMFRLTQIGMAGAAIVVGLNVMVAVGPVIRGLG